MRLLSQYYIILKIFEREALWPLTGGLRTKFGIMNLAIQLLNLVAIETYSIPVQLPVPSPAVSPSTVSPPSGNCSSLHPSRHPQGTHNR